MAGNLNWQGQKIGCSNTIKKWNDVIKNCTKMCFFKCLQGGSRPHVIFAKNEVRISIFDDGTQGKELPTGFSADVEGKQQSYTNEL